MGPSEWVHFCVAGSDADSGREQGDDDLMANEGAATALAQRLHDLGVKGVLILMAERGQILELRCEMPMCFCPSGRNHFDIKLRAAAPLPDWAPNADHYPTLKADKGHLDPWNVRLAHVRCNHDD